MEFLIYTTLTILMWLLSISWLLPFVIFLKLSKKYREKWFSWFFFKVFGPSFNPVYGGRTTRAFDLLKEHLKSRKKEHFLEVLEIGAAGGSNLPFYPENSNLTVLDKNDSFIKRFEENRKKYPQVTYKETVIAMAEDMREIHGDSFDVVVCTYVLCSVKSVGTALKEIKRVLKPGGKFLFVEHIIFPGVSWKAILQTLTSPLWKIYFDGCNLDRKTDEEIRKAGFSDVVMNVNCPENIWLYIRPRIYGIATK